MSETDLRFCANELHDCARRLEEEAKSASVDLAVMEDVARILLRFTLPRIVRFVPPSTLRMRVYEGDSEVT